MNDISKSEWAHIIGWDKVCERMANPELHRCKHTEGGLLCLDNEGHKGPHYVFDVNKSYRKDNQ